AHGTAHERELEGARDDVDSLQSSAHDDERVALADGLLGRREAVAVALRVAEPERVLRRDVGADFSRALGIEELRQALACADAHVMRTFRADLQVALDLRPVEHRVAGRALHPETLGHRARAALGLDARGDDLLEPGHLTPRPARRS